MEPDRRKKHRSSRHERHHRDRDDRRNSKRKHRSHHDEDDGEREKRKKHRRGDEDDGRRRSDDEEDERRRRHRSSSSKKRSSKKEGRDGGDRDRKERSTSRKESKKKDHKKEKKKKKDRGNGNHSKTKTKRISSEERQLLTPLGNRPGKPPSTLLDAGKDYFSYHRHLWVYLHREEGVAFNDLTSDESHEAFGRFVKRYNSGKLEAAFYDPKGLPAAALEECKTTRHSWTFKTSEREDKSLRALQEGVRKQTEYDATTSANQDGDGRGELTSKPHSMSDSNRQQKGDDPGRTSRRSAEDRSKDRVANRRLREHVRTVEDELSGGRKDGRERQIEKRKEQAARIHGAARDREAGAVGVELDDQAMYGGEAGGEIGFRAAMAREKQRAAEREDKRKKHIADLQRKEKEKQEEMLKKLGLTGIKPGEKIKIAPRKDR